jgi:hypothetical protein
MFFVLSYQGRRHTPRMHRSLQTYCANLNPLSLILDFPASSARCLHFPHDARDPSSERWNFVGENCPIISPNMSTSTLHVGIFLYAANLRHGTDGFTSPPKEGLLRIFFFALKNPTASAGFVPANLGTKGQHAYPQTTEAAISTCYNKVAIKYCIKLILKLSNWNTKYEKITYSTASFHFSVGLSTSLMWY